MPSLGRSLATGGTKTRVQGVSSIQTVKATPGFLWRIIVANANAAAQTLTVTDGSTAQVVIEVPATDTRTVEFQAPFTTSIKLTPSHANIDALCIYD